MIRHAKASDAERILHIYTYSIVNSPASFETEVPSLEEFKARVESYQKKYPWLVYEVDGKVVGYAYASEHRTRSAYNWTAECSVYVDRAYFGRGIGKLLYTELFNLIRKQGVVNVLAGITLPNAGSVRLHESFGFVKVAHYPEVGYKLGTWWDVGWWQLQLEKPVRPDPVKNPG